MTRHFIIMSSSYSQGQRIALDICGIGAADTSVLYKIIEKIKLKCGEDTSISVHSIETSSE